MSGARHEWIDELCARLERVLLGRLAEAYLAGPLPEQAALVVTPVWRWLAPRIEMGRKTRRADGATMLMPVRMAWGPSPLLLVTEPVEVAWSMAGLGHTGAGSVRLVPCVGAPPRTGDDFPTAGEVGVPPLTRRQLTDQLRALAADGDRARWDALMSLEHYVGRAVRSAVVSVSYDVSGAEPDQTPAWVLDETGSQAVADRMLLGADGTPGRVTFLLERCLSPSAFVRVDPLKYVVTDLHRAAEAEVRKTIGDPHIGRKVRAIHRTMPSASLADVIDAYRAKHPGDHLSTVRAARALTAGPDVMGGCTDLNGSPLNLSVASHEDAVVAQMDRAREVTS